MQQKTSSSSWIQLVFFTLFLFLLVAIPYTVYIRSIAQQKVTILDLPQPTIFHLTTHITPPAASTTTVCFPVPNSYSYTVATPAAYLFQDARRRVCFPPILPPYPFTWHRHTDYKEGFTLDTPENLPVATTSAMVSFAWQDGQDPFATDSSYLQTPITRNIHAGIVYTKTASFISAVFPLGTGYIIIGASRDDPSFYAFEHMVDSLNFSSQ